MSVTPPEYQDYPMSYEQRTGRRLPEMKRLKADRKSILEALRTLNELTGFIPPTRTENENRH
jgi:hypothetical protein